MFPLHPLQQWNSLLSEAVVYRELNTLQQKWLLKETFIRYFKIIFRSLVFNDTPKTPCSEDCFILQMYATAAIGNNSHHDVIDK